MVNPVERFYTDIELSPSSNVNIQQEVYMYWIFSLYKSQTLRLSIEGKHVFLSKKIYGVLKTHNSEKPNGLTTKKVQVD